MDGSGACGCGFELAASEMSGKLEVVQETNLDCGDRRERGSDRFMGRGKSSKTRTRNMLCFCIFQLTH